MFPYFLIDITEFVKIAIPVALAVIVLWIQMGRNRKMQAESTFFNLLNSIRNLVSNTEGEISSERKMTYDNVEKRKAKGISYFSEANKELQKRLILALGNSFLEGTISQQIKDIEGIKAAHRNAKEVYDKFFEDHIVELAHYYRFTYNVLNFVHMHPDISRAKKVQYIKFVQSQMSDSELQLLFYNGIGKHGSKYYAIIEKYNFLENITTSGNKGMIDFLENFYPKSTFRL